MEINRNSRSKPTGDWVPNKNAVASNNVSFVSNAVGLFYWLLKTKQKKHSWARYFVCRFPSSAFLPRVFGQLKYSTGREVCIWGRSPRLGVLKWQSHTTRVQLWALMLPLFSQMFTGIWRRGNYPECIWRWTCRWLVCRFWLSSMVWGVEALPSGGHGGRLGGLGGGGGS